MTQIRMRGAGPARFVALPAGTIQVKSHAVCASVRGMSMQPCFNVEQTVRDIEAAGEVLARVTTDLLDGSVGDFIRSHGGSVSTERAGDEVAELAGLVEVAQHVHEAHDRADDADGRRRIKQDEKNNHPRQSVLDSLPASVTRLAVLDRVKDKEGNGANLNLRMTPFGSSFRGTSSRCGAPNDCRELGLKFAQLRFARRALAAPRTPGATAEAAVRRGAPSGPGSPGGCRAGR